MWTRNYYFQISFEYSNDARSHDYYTVRWVPKFFSLLLCCKTLFWKKKIPKKCILFTIFRCLCCLPNVISISMHFYPFKYRASFNTTKIVILQVILNESDA